ncbi:MAG: sulfite exporter TauE/SafE family protein [Proteobacteria bacterium]|nr:sulfite exporter TauE/SafE family protein [Pseudomonadota bacterium]MBU1449870.1 sulfite exporter TauE/SafE family protein [Pseudomonadota bacterium]MBU2469629.1 sulfite exporter TauE/SafE family protein [Pseudomonadota bacterium]MBU2516701.1 sulfite exporter TauE/SafE family protein [Pseudomonadota bacterium]
MPQELALALIFLVSGFTMSFAGFGFALVSVPLLALLLPIKDAVALQFPYCLALFLYQAWHYRAHFSWGPMRPLVLGTALGLAIGTFMLYNLPEAALKRALAGFIAAVVLFNALPAGKAFVARHAQSPWWGRFCGFVSGSFFGAYTIGGPPAALYIMSVSDDALKAKSFLASFFSIQFILMAFVYGAGGMFSWEGLRGSLIYSPAVIAGSALGFWAFAKASNRLYRQVVSLMLMATAIVLWWRA